MSSSNRFRTVSKDVAPISVPTSASYPIEKGDFLGLSAGVAKPAAQFATAAAFKAAFIGVALQKNGLQSGETSARLTTDKGYIQVATKGEFEYPCASHTWANEDLVEVDVANGACLNQQVDDAADYTTAIAVAKPTFNQLGVAQTSIIISLRSVVGHDTLLSNQ